MFNRLKITALIEPLLCGGLLAMMTACGGGSETGPQPSSTQESATTTTGSTNTNGTTPSGPPSLILLSGAPGGVGNADGIGGRFAAPNGIAFDMAGNLVVSDGPSIRRIDMLSTLGISSLYVPVLCLQFSQFYNFCTDSNLGGITVSPDGSVFIPDKYYGGITRFLPSGEFIYYGGNNSSDPTNDSPYFSRPDSVVTDTQGTIYVADTGNSTIRMIAPNGTTSTLAGSTRQYDILDGTGPEARFKAPVGIARDNEGNLYVGDENTIRRISPSGVVRTIAGSPNEAGSVDGTGSAARFYKPTSLAVDKAGNIFLRDSGNFTIRRVTQAGVVTTIARGIFTGYLAIDKADNVFFSQLGGKVIRKMAPDGTLSTVAGLTLQVGDQDGPANLARFGAPGASMATDRAGNVYVSANRTIRKIAPDGSTTSLLSQADPTMKGVLADSHIFTRRDQFNPYDELNPYSPAAIPRDGSVYAFDQRRLYKIMANGSKTFIAGNTDTGTITDGVGAAASFSAPRAVTVDANGNVYLLDKELSETAGNIYLGLYASFPDGKWQSIRKVTPAGVVSTVAGCTTSKNCVSTLPISISTFALDRHGDIYIAASNEILKTNDIGTMPSNSIWKASANGTMRNVAKIEGCCDGIAALAVGGDDTVYFADNSSFTISKIAPNGTVSLLAGRPNVLGAIAGPLPATLGKVAGMTVGADNTLYVMMENAIFKIK